jgi:type I restriction enzyme S subunit
LQRVKKERLQNFEIPLPPLDIQRAIVTKLDESFAEIEEAIALTEGNITKTEEFKKSVLDRILEE